MKGTRVMRLIAGKSINTISQHYAVEDGETQYKVELFEFESRSIASFFTDITAVAEIAREYFESSGLRLMCVRKLDGAKNTVAFVYLARNVITDSALLNPNRTLIDPLIGIQFMITDDKTSLYPEIRPYKNALLAKTVSVQVPSNGKYAKVTLINSGDPVRLPLVFVTAVLLNDVKMGEPDESPDVVFNLGEYLRLYRAVERVLKIALNVHDEDVISVPINGLAEKWSRIEEGAMY